MQGGARAPGAPLVPPPMHCKLSLQHSVAVSSVVERNYDHKNALRIARYYAIVPRACQISRSSIVYSKAKKRS